MTIPEAHYLRQAGARIESLLTDLRSVADPIVHEKAEELVQVLVEVYGAGLGRIVEIVGNDTETGEAQVQRLADDEFVASLLILHGLHPQDTETRVQNALDKVRPYLGSHAGGCTYLGIDETGVVHLRLEGSCQGCPSSTITVKMAIERAIEAAAPEISGIEVEGVAERPAERVITMDSLRRNAPPANGHLDEGHWASPAGFDARTAGDVTATEIDGEQIVVLPTKLVLAMRYAVFAEATLAFLGLGAGDALGWGAMLNEAFRDPLLFSRPVWPWLVLPPALAIAALILATVGVSSGAGGGVTGRRQSGRRVAPSRFIAPGS